MGSVDHLDRPTVIHDIGGDDNGLGVGYTT